VTLRLVTRADASAIEDFIARTPEIHSRRFSEILRSALDNTSGEYLAAVAEEADGITGVCAFGHIAGTIDSAALYGVAPISKTSVDLLAYAERELRARGMKRIVAEFPDAEEYKSYREVLLDSHYHPVGFVEDLYRDGVGMVIFVRLL
jgi:hypothetical protein